MWRDPQVVTPAASRAATHEAPRRPGGRAAVPRRRRVAQALPVALLAIGLAGCATKDDARSRPSPTADAIGAHLVPTGNSTVGGLITFQPYEGGVTMVAEVVGLAGAGIYRVVIHANGNCTSTNAFSAGPPLLLAGSSAPVVVEFTAQTEGRQAFAQRIRGLSVDRLVGRAVVVHAGFYGSLDAQPGVPNDRVGCGAIGAMRPLF
jgi:Cu/Zn superoxide dismutase